jgi:hypothetical protein
MCSTGNNNVFTKLTHIPIVCYTLITKFTTDDDDFLGGLGIEDKGSAGPVPSAAEIEDLDSEEEEKPSRMFDKLLDLYVSVLHDSNAS